jgi:hypothetical protein
MISRRLMLIAVTALGAALCTQPWVQAYAHGPTRQKLELDVDVAAPPAKVWAVIGNFHDLSWVPAVATVTGPGGNDPNTATRTITLKAGGVLPLEELTDYDASKFAYGTFLPHVDPKTFPVADYSSHLIVTPIGNRNSHIAWRTAFYRGYPNNNPPADMNEAAAVKAVTAFCQPGLDALKAKFGAAH